jgi:hypothetical protein
MVVGNRRGDSLPATFLLKKHTIMNKHLNTYFTILTLVVLSSCKVSQDISTPEAPLPHTYRDAQSRDTANIAKHSMANILW